MGILSTFDNRKKMDIEPLIIRADKPQRLGKCGPCSIVLQVNTIGMPEPAQIEDPQRIVIIGKLGSLPPLSPGR